MIQDDEELRNRLSFLSNELDLGTYPIQKTVLEMCELIAQWSEERNPEQMSDYLKDRHRAAQVVEECLKQADWHKGRGDHDAVVHSAFTAGSIFAEFGHIIAMREIEPDARSGAKVKAGAKKGHEHTHGTLKQKEDRAAKYRNRLQTLISDPALKHLKITQLREKVGKEYGVSLKTITRYTKGIKK